MFEVPLKRRACEDRLALLVRGHKTHTLKNVVKSGTEDYGEIQKLLTKICSAINDGMAMEAKEMAEANEKKKDEEAANNAIRAAGEETFARNEGEEDTDMNVNPDERDRMLIDAGGMDPRG